MKVIQEILGDSMLSTTAARYAHLVPAAFDEAASAIDRAFGVETGSPEANCRHTVVTDRDAPWRVKA